MTACNQRKLWTVGEQWKLWTVGEQWKLCEMYYNIVPIEDIAQQLGRTKSACYSRMAVIKQAFVMFSDMAEDDIMAALNQIEEASK